MQEVVKEVGKTNFTLQVNSLGEEMEPGSQWTC